MISLNEISNDLLLLMNGGKVTDDTDNDLRQIKYWIKNQRALWIRNEINKNRSIDPAIIQDLGCVEMETSDSAECCSVFSNCDVLRSVEEIPTPIEMHHKSAITRVGPVDKLIKPFGFVPYEQAIFSGNGRFNKNIMFSFLRDKRMYLIKKDIDIKYKALKYINIQGVFEDPEEVGTFTDCTGVACYTDDSTYPINRWMVEYMKAQIVENNMKLILTIPTDESNDASGNVKMQ